MLGEGIALSKNNSIVYFSDSHYGISAIEVSDPYVILYIYCKIKQKVKNIFSYFLILKKYSLESLLNNDNW